MKKLLYISLALLAINFSFTACSDEDPISTVTPDDQPRILDPIFADSKDGKLPIIADIDRDHNLDIQLTVTPSEYCTVTWFMDGIEIQKGTHLDMGLKAGTYDFKVTVTTEAGKSTYREGIVLVNPLIGDPWSTEKGAERIIVPGIKARFYGDNLNKVRSIIIDNNTITDIAYIESEDGNYIEYTVPSNLTEGEYRVIFVDVNASEYGANKVVVSKDALVTGGVSRTNSNREWVITGVNLDQIVSLKFANQTFTEFIRHSATEVVIICPQLEDGKYSLTGTTKNGKSLQFYNTNGITDEQTVVVSSETVLWQGHHYVSWDLPDSSPNKSFNLIAKDVFASLSAGSTLRIQYSVEAADTYHQLRTASGWWNDLPGTSVIEFSQDGVKEVLLTQEVLNKIQNEDGFLIIGHGYYVDMVSVD